MEEVEGTEGVVGSPLGEGEGEGEGEEDGEGVVRLPEEEGDGDGDGEGVVGLPLEEGEGEEGVVEADRTCKMTSSS